MDSTEPVPQIIDTAREVHPIDLFPTWDVQAPNLVRRTPAEIYAQDFHPGVPDEVAAPEKQADTGGGAKP